MIHWTQMLFVGCALACGGAVYAQSPSFYGNFTVSVNENGSQTIEGGVYTPQGDIAYHSNARFLFLINYTEKTLEVYEKEGERYVPKKGFAVVTPRSETLTEDVVKGRVTAIVHEPVWCPVRGGAIRRDNPGLPRCVPYGDPRNPMGDVRFDIAWEISGWDAIKLHGSKGYPQGDFWKEDTYGCSRLLNSEIRDLVRFLGVNAVTKGIEVVVIKDTPPTMRQ